MEDDSKFLALLRHLREISTNGRHYGSNFEILTKQFLLAEPRYKAHFSKIELWADWAAAKNPQTGKRNWANTKDIGIDLVATRFDGVLCAIQCKFFLESRISKEMLNSFIAASGASVFAERMFVATGGLSDNLENALRTQEPPILCLNKASFENSSIDWEKYTPEQDYLARIPLKTPHFYQETAIHNVLAEFKQHERGRLIMACGTGKTFTSLKIAERQAGKGGIVLFCVPSLALLSQSLREWTAQSQTPIVPFAVCSDASAGRITLKAKEADEVEYIANELDFPATTDARNLAQAVAQARAQKPDAMQVIFSTYHSMEAVSEAQEKYALPEIDLIICDEAHRTAGQSNKGEDKRFAEILKADFIRAKKRLFMTATPIVYTPSSKKAADERDITLYSMDNEALYGPLFHSISFSQAVRYECLCDYKLLLLAVSAEQVSKDLQAFLDKDDSGVKLDDATKMVGCYRALAKIGLKSQVGESSAPMRSAIAFAQVIDHSADKVSSRDFAENFPKIAAAFQQVEAERGAAYPQITIEAQHIDGSMSGNQRENALNFLKAASGGAQESGKPLCRVLSNVRCLSEGVDVPALDAVLFLSGKNSQVEITQAVGRVMRNAPGKKLGYVILPVVIPQGQTEEQFLSDSTIWKTTYQVVQALRSHDAGIDNSIARAERGDFGGKIEIVDMRNLAASSMEEKTGAKRSKSGNPQGENKIGTSKDASADAQMEMEFHETELMRGIFAKLADRCGTRLYWPQWAARFGKVADTLKLRITNILASDDADYAAAKTAFAELEQALQSNISEAIDQKQALNILAAQAIAMPVFSSLFGAGEHDFPANNVVAKSLQNALEAILKFMASERGSLERLYTEIRAQLGENPTDAFRQSLIKDIYQNTIKAVYGEKEAKTVVYTPIEAIDFMLRSVADVLESEFGSSFSADNITLLDPFAGTGAFLARLMQGTRRGKDGKQQPLVMPAALPTLYRDRMWINEINLLAYYAAVANLETTYHAQTGEWREFVNGLLTDTFTLNHKQADMPLKYLRENFATRENQEKALINIILTNPPYSGKQSSANDNAQNVKYPELDEIIRKTYVAGAVGTKNLNSLYDYYIRAIKWATLRLERTEAEQKARGLKPTGGIAAFITNGRWLDSAAASGMRKHLAKDFSDLYIFNLRGDIRAELSKKDAPKPEGDNIFGIQTGIAISILVRNPNAEEWGKIFYRDIGDDIKKLEKLKILEENSLATLPFAPLVPDQYGDWLNQRDDSVLDYPMIGNKKDKSGKALFENYSNGLKTQRDGWAWNVSRIVLVENMQKTIRFYNGCTADKTPVYDRAEISWSRALENNCRKGKKSDFNAASIRSGLYRPFTRSQLYFSRQWNEMVYKIPACFPFESAKNLLIGVSGVSASDFSVFITDIIPDLNYLSAGSQNFPLYLYEELEDRALDNSAQEGEIITAPQGSVNANGEDISGQKFLRRSAITDYALDLFRKNVGGGYLQGRYLLLYLWPAPFAGIPRKVQKQPAERTAAHSLR